VAQACRSAADCASGRCAQGTCSLPDFPCNLGSWGCAQFTDLRDAGVANIRFPAGGNRYSPSCLRVNLGQTVTFSGGDFSVHTLEQGCGPAMGIIGAGSGQSFSVTFNQGLGLYGYYCQQHGSANGSGMSGSIEVVR
jgi:plastocyanin